MNEIEYVVYWTTPTGVSASVTHTTLPAALQDAEQLRRAGRRFVTMCSENLNSIGKPGVDEVKDGKTPDGVEYSWVKRRDGGQ